MGTTRANGHIAIVIGIIAIVVLAAVGYVVFQRSRPSLAPAQSALFEGSVQKLDQNLGLFTDPINPGSIATSSAYYYTAGKYVSGPYNGYTRYVGIQDTATPLGTVAYVFASNDGQTFVLDGDPAPVDSLKTEDGTSPFVFVNAAKISKIERLPSEQPEVLPLSNQFIGDRNVVAVVATPTGQKDQYGNNVYVPSLATDTSQFSQLPYTNPQLSIFAPSYIVNGNPNFTPDPQYSPPPQQAYLQGPTQLIVIDGTGLPMSYNMANKANETAYGPLQQQWQASMSAYTSKNAAYNNEVQSLNDRGITDSSLYPSPPPYPMPPDKPNLRMTQAQIQAPGQQLYQNYSVAFPSGCGLDVNTSLTKNIAASDLQKIGNSIDGDVYALTNPNHPLLKAAYDYKVNIMPLDGWDSVNKIPKPTYEQYVAKNPLLFFQDNWDRWFVLGEYDILLPGGCGKPVLYLYPEKPTVVSVQFAEPMRLDVQIPSYNNGWKVLAQPNGQLTNVESEDCRSIDTSRAGSEYAAKACKENKYPYIYWSGDSLTNVYPSPVGGWVVAKDDLNDFLNQKLNEVGLTSQEKSDMISYWLPVMQKHNAPYYRVSFLQNMQLDQLVPMTIHPKPDRFYRLFLDYQPLIGLPSQPLAPQSLNSIVRDGFTVVEWGGKHHF